MEIQFLMHTLCILFTAHMLHSCNKSKTNLFLLYNAFIFINLAYVLFFSRLVVYFSKPYLQLNMAFALQLLY